MVDCSAKSSSCGEADSGKNFCSARWHDTTRRGETKVDVAFTTNVGSRYTLRLYVPDDWPNSCPNLTIVWSSKIVKQRNGNSLPQYSSTFHTLGSIDGYQCLCHYDPCTWSANNTMYLVFLKGRLWLEAYENHLRTGKDIDRFLKHM